MLKPKIKKFVYILYAVLALGLGLGLGPSRVLADPVSPQTGATQQQNADCQKQGGVLGFDSATGHNSCTTCDVNRACITKDSTTGSVLPLYYPAACKAVQGTYTGTLEGNTNTVRCQLADSSYVNIGVQQGGLPLPEGTVQSVRPDNGGHTVLTNDSQCNEAQITRGNCRIFDDLIKFIDVLSAAVGVIIVAIITFRGVQYTFSRDNAQDTKKAKDGIRDAVLALVLYLLLASFLQWIVPGGVF